MLFIAMTGAGSLNSESVRLLKILVVASHLSKAGFHFSARCTGPRRDHSRSAGAEFRHICSLASCFAA
jgi:hypothetical protein